MPNQPNDRFQQDPERMWRSTEPADRCPTQPRYRGPRIGGDPDGLSWAEVNRRPAVASPHHLNTR